MPDEPVQWRQQDGKGVTYYAFLVVLEDLERSGRYF